MVRAIRTATAAALIAALACLPVVLDRCASTCEAHATALATPPCHHAESAAAHVSRVPAGCHHDHTAVGSAEGASSIPHRTIEVVAVISTAQLPPAQQGIRLRSTHAPPASPAPIHARSLPLRV